MEATCSSATSAEFQQTARSYISDLGLCISPFSLQLHGSVLQVQLVTDRLGCLGWVSLFQVILGYHRHLQSLANLIRA
jgi:hypothetical protein